MGFDSGIWRCLDTYRGSRRLVALPGRPLGMGVTLGLDVGGCCSVGLRAISLRSLGLSWDAMVLGAGTTASATGVRAGARCLGGKPGLQCWLVSARTP